MFYSKGLILCGTAQVARMRHPQKAEGFRDSRKAQPERILPRDLIRVSPSEDRFPMGAP
jgi:hypothetical protein